MKPTLDLGAHPSLPLTAMQEFAAALRRTGACTIDEMVAEVRLLRATIDRSEAEALTELGRRRGYVEARTDAFRADGKAIQTPEWVLTDRGFALPRPRSLAVVHVLASLVRLADPVRRQAGDWIPAIALLLGVTAGAAANTSGALITEIARGISVAMLGVVLAIHAHGEFQIVRFARAWSAMADRAPAHVGLYSRARLVVISLSVVCQLVAYALLIFGQWIPAGLTVVAALLLAYVQFGRWHLPALIAEGGRWVSHVPWIVKLPGARETTPSRVSKRGVSQRGS